MRQHLQILIFFTGERNTYYHQSQYNCSFPAMIDDWRKSWFEGTGEQTPSQFPFGFVQVIFCIYDQETCFNV